MVRSAYRFVQAGYTYMISETGRWQRDDKIWETDGGDQRMDHFGSGMDKDTCYQRAG